MTQPVEVPTMDPSTHTIYDEFLPTAFPSKWTGQIPSSGGGTVDTIAGTGSTGRDLMKAATPTAARDIIGAVTIAAATEASAGSVELATVAEAKAGTDTTRAVTPAGVAAVLTGAGSGVKEWYPRAGGIATNAVDMVAGTFPPHPIMPAEAVLVYVNRPGGPAPTADGNRLTGGGGMDVIRQPPDRYIAL